MTPCANLPRISCCRRYVHMLERKGLSPNIALVRDLSVYCCTMYFPRVKDIRFGIRREFVPQRVGYSVGHPALDSSLR